MGFHDRFDLLVGFAGLGTSRTPTPLAETFPNPHTIK